MIAIFGSKSFQVSSQRVYPLDNLTLSGVLNSEAQDAAAGQKPSTYIKGPGLDSMSFDIPMVAELNVDPRKEYDEWTAIKDASQPYIFTLNGKPIGANKWLLKGVTLNTIVLDHNGFMIRANLNLQFEEYVRPGKKPSTGSVSGSSGKSKKTSATAKVSALDDILKIPNDPTPAEKASKVRDNVHAQVVFVNGRKYVM